MRYLTFLSFSAPGQLKWLLNKTVAALEGTALFLLDPFVNARLAEVLVALVALCHGLRLFEANSASDLCRPLLQRRIRADVREVQVTKSC